MPSQIRIGDSYVDLGVPQDQGTSGALRDIFIGDVYGLERLRNASIQSVLDVGAHSGLFSLAARHYFPDATIHAYEPNPALWQYLNSQAINGNFTAFKEGVSGACGVADLHFGEDTVHTKCILNGNGSIPIIGIAEAIDRACKGTCLDLLKMDCEGAEWSILAEHESIRRVRYITMEYHLDETHHFPDLVALLKRLSFQIAFSHTDGATCGVAIGRNSRQSH